MSNFAATPADAGTDVQFPTSNVDVPLPWLAQVWKQSISQRAARFGLAWISVVAFCAIFAPLLANSFPIAIKMNGRWSSPFLHQLTATDVTLPILTLLCGILCFVRRIGFLSKIYTMLIATVIVGSLAFIFIRPPNTPRETYRLLERAGRLQSVVRTPIPYTFDDRLYDQFSADHPHPWAPSHDHWMGTEKFGADITSQMIYACRIAMAIGFISTGISVLIGIVFGGLMGYFVGIVDLLGMRVIEIVGAIPTIYLLLIFVAAFPDYRSIYLIMAIIGLTSWTGDARFVRAEFLKLRNQEFVHAAIAAGLPLRSVLFKHLLPNALAPLLVSASFGIAGAILSESTLSFLGLGIPVGDASWGALLNEAVSAGGGFIWWLATYPGLAIFLTVLSYNFIGEAVRDALDPKLRERS